jgi:O-antigen ligase
VASAITNQNPAAPFPQPPGPWRAGPPASPAAQQDPEFYSIFRRVGLYCLLGVVFLLYTRLHETLALHYGIAGRFLYLFSIPALVGLLLSHGIRRVFSGRPVFYWMAFVVWMVIVIPFSVWRGGAVATVYDFLRGQIPIMILLAGLPITWKECRLVLCTIGVSGVINVIASQTFGQAYGGRAGLESETIGNPNDYAGQLLMVLPFVIYMLLHPPRLMQTLLRVLGGAALLYGTYLILASGSRGAMLGLVAACGFVLMKSGGRARLAVLVLLAISLGLMIALLPGAVLSRLSSFSAENGSRNEETQSAALRKRLLTEGLMTTVVHPLFGVGAGQFGNFQGTEKKEGAEHVVGYINAHNSYVQISADTGIPGILLYMGGVISPFLLLLRTWKRVRGSPEHREKASACFCLMAAWVGFCVAIFFLNFGYFFYLPAFAGLAVALHGAIGRELKAAPIRVSMAAPRPAMAAAVALPAPAPPRASNRFRFNRYR